MSDALLAMVREFSVEIQNGRTLEDIVRHTRSEVDELEEEVSLIGSEEAGDDGVVGEAIDVMLCAIDAIFVADPNITEEAIIAYARKKCEKWARRSKSSPDGDRTID